jgi:hypothetical protein
LRAISAISAIDTDGERALNYQDWLPLFGLAAHEPAVLAMLASQGVKTPVTLPRQWSSTAVDFRELGVSIGFTSEFNLSGGAADVPIVSRFAMKLILGKTAKNWSTFTGALPHDLLASYSKDKVVSVLGEPTKLSQDYRSASWIIDGQQLGIHFTDDWAHIKQLGLSIPGAT